MPTYRDEAIAIRSIRLGEADRIVTFLTPEHGKVRAVAKGVRKTKSKIGARVEPPSHVALMCWRGRELDVVSQAETLDAFRAVRDSLELFGSAIAMLEVADQIALERTPMPELFALTLNALRTLERTRSPLVPGAYFLKLLVLEGVGPVTDVCVSCGEPGPLVAFDPGDGGFLCSSCRRGIPVAPEIVALVQAVLSGGLARVLAESPANLAPGFDRLTIAAVEHHLERRLRTTRHLFEPEGQR
ncbi:MAG TPA: DNA repair protein RecO [Acidimicrobiales bacterium]|jgi:DNA repair protein RecO (recombination protein O)|nr:DNA repair protein RecO [Acidimicrobiales bacterium]